MLINLLVTIILQLRIKRKNLKRITDLPKIVYPFQKITYKNFWMESGIEL
jgi:hypothetical protein